MELKYTIATVFLLLLLDLPHFSSGYHGRLMGEGADSSREEVYEIDYRGPETHPVLPFPSRGRRRPWFHPQHPNSRPLDQSEDSNSKVNEVRG